MFTLSINNIGTQDTVRTTHATAADARAAVDAIWGPDAVRGNDTSGTIGGSMVTGGVFQASKVWDIRAD